MRKRRGERAGAVLAVTLAAGLLGAAAVPLPPPRPADDRTLPATPPLPPPRPPEQGPPAPAAILHPPTAPAAASPPATTVPAPPLADAADAPAACAALLASGKLAARALPPVVGTGGCGMAAPLEVTAIVVGPARRVTLMPPVTAACGVAAALADWVTADLVPLLDGAGLPLIGLVDSSGYSCRGRNRVAGAKLSEHGLGDAVDIGGLAVAGRGVIGVKDSRTDLLAGIRRTACARFATVLGPGSDSYHEAHLHVDIEHRRNGGRLCQWTLP